jgi:outer membrane protein assembly factor BamB
LLKKRLAFGVVVLFLVSSIIPQTIFIAKKITEHDLKNGFYENCSTDYRLQLPYYQSHLNLSQYFDMFSEEQDFTNNNEIDRNLIKNSMQDIYSASNSGPMNSPWPMHGYDDRSTGRSPYDTSNTTSLEKWRFYVDHDVGGGAIIDKNGIIYFCDNWGTLYALYPNGTQKWRVQMWNFGASWFGNSPTIDDNGIIYIGGQEMGLVAVNSNGTILWNYGANVDASPVIGPDGIIYCSFSNGVLRALYSNGTIKWSFQANYVIQSSPAIGLDGNIVFGSHDTYVYSLYPDNGSLKWKYQTGNWVHGSPTIGTDGTIYIGSDDGYFYALYPNNGTLKWKLSTGATRSSPSLDEEGTLYFATELRFWAVYPNGTTKWTFSPNEDSGDWGSTAALSNDGVIYFGFEKRCLYDEGGWIFALDLNGTELWRKTISNEFISSSPCIGSDGTVYIGSEWVKRIGPGNSWAFTGYLHAFGPIDSNLPPNPPQIIGTVNGTAGANYDYWVTATDPDNNPISLNINWSDGTYTDWTGECASGETITFDHTWLEKGTYQIRMKTRDVFGVESNWSNPYTVNIKGPSFRILEIKGGLGISVKVKNTEMFDLTNINWNISFSNCFILRPLNKCKTGTINILGARETTTIYTFVFGLGRATISINVGDASASTRSFIIGPFNRIIDA